MSLARIRKELRSSADRDKARFLQVFFKTGKDQYGHGDVFLGITVPEVRRIVRPYILPLPLTSCQTLINSQFHEERLAALIILVERFRRTSDIAEQQQLFRFVQKNLRRVNNWDLVDLVAPNLIGPYLAAIGDNSLLEQWAQSKNLWLRRIAIVSTFAWIRGHQFKLTLGISKRLLGDSEDLIHKAVGWMLREVGKRDLPCLEKFLQQHAAKMPRTMLRYAIEKLPADKRQAYLRMKVTKERVKVRL